MTTQTSKLELRLRRSGLLVAIGVMAQLVSRLWYHPPAFFLFLGVGVVLMAAGILYYFYSILAVSVPRTDADRIEHKFYEEV